MTARIFQPVVSEPLSTQAIAAEVAETPTQVAFTGYVLDERKQPLRGATVMLKGTTSVVSTDADGHYSLQVPAGINTLLYDYVGREGRELSASNFLPVTVILKPAGGRGKSRSQR